MTGTFEGRPSSFRANKTTPGGLSMVLHLSENELAEWAKLASGRGKNFVFEYRESEHQPDHPDDE